MFARNKLYRADYLSAMNIFPKHIILKSYFPLKIKEKLNAD